MKTILRTINHQVRWNTDYKQITFENAFVSYATIKAKIEGILEVKQECVILIMMQFFELNPWFMKNI